MLASKVVEKVRFFEQAKSSIRSNQNYSDTGKERALNNLQESIEAFQPSAVTSLKNEWAFIRRWYAEIQEGTRNAEAAEGERWNYERLKYENEQVKEVINNASSLSEIEEKYKQVAFNGSREKWRSWAETGRNQVQKHFPNEMLARDLVATMNQDLARLTTTEEMTKVREAGERMVVQADELWEQTHETQQFFSNAGVQSSSDFSGILDGVSLTKKVIPETLETITTLEINEPEPERVMV